MNRIEELRILLITPLTEEERLDYQIEFLKLIIEAKNEKDN